MSATSRSCIETAEQIELFLAQRQLTLDLFYNTGCFSLKLCPKIRTLKISQLHVDRHTYCQLRRTLSVINWWWSSVASLSH